MKFTDMINETDRMKFEFVIISRKGKIIFPISENEYDGEHICIFRDGSWDLIACGEHNPITDYTKGILILIETKSIEKLKKILEK